ncbi:hypothetical protein [Nocardioides plantarum]|uniref:Uncharacterized protein n=1 Tax=Nocardioides plantarum TaxID=29299 RepID=A0ABV5KBD5_9ACTN|nr:hypothetical protein [Nocardioides plantarum]
MTDSDQPTRPSIWSDLAPTLAWLALFVLATIIAFLAFYPPHVNFERDAAEPRSGTVCTSVAVAGWPHANASSVGDGVDDVGRAPGYDDAVSACQTRRTGAVALMAVLTVPISLTGCWLMVSRPRRRSA